VVYGLDQAMIGGLMHSCVESIVYIIIYTMLKVRVAGQALGYNVKKLNCDAILRKCDAIKIFYRNDAMQF
jgi:hypothetical protein